MQWSLYRGNKKSATFKWLLVILYRWLLYREKFYLKTYGRTIAWSLRTGGCFKKVVIKTGLTVLLSFDASICSRMTFLPL